LARVLCSEQAQQRLEMLASEAREACEAVEERLDYLTEMPRMYALTDDERFPGCRSFRVEPCYRVFYMVAAGADDVYVVAVTEEEIDTPGEAGATEW
jgi:mRNA-degrading endonuclease RelE of RelBE toxin-antitoxin system